ncbi:MAG TPA: hypothetical protein VIO11_10975 [Candidatus Methanoperedens sp.]
MVLRTLDADYRSFMAMWANRDKDAQPPGFKSKNNFTTMVYNQSGFRLKMEESLLPSIIKRTCHWLLIY